MDAQEPVTVVIQQADDLGLFIQYAIPAICGLVAIVLGLMWKSRQGRDAKDEASEI